MGAGLVAQRNEAAVAGAQLEQPVLPAVGQERVPAFGGGVPELRRRQVLDPASDQLVGGYPSAVVTPDVTAT